MLLRSLSRLSANRPREMSFSRKRPSPTKHLASRLRPPLRCPEEIWDWQVATPQPAFETPTYAPPPAIEPAVAMVETVPVPAPPTAVPVTPPIIETPSADPEPPVRHVFVERRKIVPPDVKARPFIRTEYVPTYGGGLLRASERLSATRNQLASQTAQDQTHMAMDTTSDAQEQNAAPRRWGLLSRYDRQYTSYRGAVAQLL